MANKNEPNALASDIAQSDNAPIINASKLIATGIGSRETPWEFQQELKKIAIWIAKHGGRVRSGHADGADWAVESGAVKNCDVFLPWQGFNSELPMLGNPIVVHETPELNELVKKYHPNPSKLKRGGWALMRRNGCQILGLNLDSPSDAVFCWAPKNKGGTGQAIRIALDLNIPVFNMSEPEFGTADLVIDKLKLIIAQKESSYAPQNL